MGTEADEVLHHPTTNNNNNNNNPTNNGNTNTEGHLISSPFSLPRTNAFETLLATDPQRMELGCSSFVSLHVGALVEFGFHPPSFTTNDAVMAKLYLEADKAGGRKQLVDDLMKIIIDHMGIVGNESFNPLDPCLPSRKTLVKRAQESIKIPSPEPQKIILESGHQVTVWRSSLAHELQQHLLSKVYSDLDNLDLPVAQFAACVVPAGAEEHLLEGDALIAGVVLTAD